MKRYVGFAALLVVISTLSGCGGHATGLLGEKLPQVRIFNGLDGQADITVTYKNSGGTSLGTSQPAPFGGISSPDMIIQNTNATPTIFAGGSALFSGASVLYRINSLYTLYSGGVAGNYVTLALNDTTVAGTTAGSMDVRGVHLGARTPAVDIYVEPAGTVGVTGSAVFQSLAFGQATTAANTTGTVDNNGYTTAPAIANGLYEIVVTAHNSPSPIATTTAILNPTVYYTIAVCDGRNGVGSSVQVLPDYH